MEEVQTEEKKFEKIEVNTVEEARKMIRDLSRIQYSRLKGRILGIIEQTDLSTIPSDKLAELKQSIVFCLKNISNDGARILEQVGKYVA